MGWWHLGSAQFTEAGTAGKGMNKAVAYLTVSVQKFQLAETFARDCGGAYLSNFTAKYAEAQAKLAKAT